MASPHRSVSPSGSPPRVRRLLHQAVMLVVESSQHFLGLIKAAKAQEQDVILRAVCIIEPQTGLPKLTRAAPISLNSLEPHYAVTLAHLMDTAQPTQFVAWVTLESEDMSAATLRGVDNASLVSLAVHTCAVIDAYQDRPVWEGPLHEPTSASRDRHGAAAVPNAFEDMSPSMARQQVLMEFRRAMGDELSPIRDESATAAPAGAAGPGVMLSEAQQRQLDDVLAVTMLCSRATAKIMTSVLEAHARLDRLFDVVAPMMNTTTMTHTMSSQLSNMDSRLRVMEEHIESIRDRQDLVHAEVRNRIAARQDQGLQVSKANMRDRWMQTEYFDVIHPEQLPRNALQRGLQHAPEHDTAEEEPTVPSSSSSSRQQMVMAAAAVLNPQQLQRPVKAAPQPVAAPPAVLAAPSSSASPPGPSRTKTPVNPLRSLGSSSAPPPQLPPQRESTSGSPPPPLRPNNNSSPRKLPPPAAPGLAEYSASGRDHQSVHAASAPSSDGLHLGVKKPPPPSQHEPFHVLRPDTGHFDAAAADLDAFRPRSLPVAAPSASTPGQRTRSWGSPTSSTL